tara:strand:- start:43 stop:267 length:225 start_codon:yes stop_codon:yes gene_type:complete
VSDTKSSEPQKLFSFTLNKEQAHAILLASFNYQGELIKLKESGDLGVAWRIVWDDWMSGHQRMHDQYKNQLDKE